MVAIQATEDRCIYCWPDEPDGPLTASHFIPDGMGGKGVLEDSVCKGCNGAINRLVEEPLRNDLMSLNFRLGLRTRRGFPRPYVDVSWSESTYRLRLDEQGEIRQLPPLHGTDELGKKGVFIVARNEATMEEQRLAYSKRHPDLRWKLVDPSTFREPESSLEYRFDRVMGLEGRRLATKIAFEMLAIKLRRENVLDHQYDAVRRFVLNGIETENVGRVCRLVYHPRLVEKNLAVPVPCHGVALIGQRGQPVLAGFVVLYGLFSYIVYVSRRWLGLAHLEEFYIIHPQTGEQRSSKLYARPRPPRIPWKELEYPDSCETDVKKKAFIFAVERLENAIREAAEKA